MVEKIQTQMQSGKNIYDGWVNDSDLIGTHFRYKQAVALDDWMAGEGKDVTIPTSTSTTSSASPSRTAPDGKMYQLPDQQFANLYWFRYDWFQRPDFKEKFKAKYGYDLGVPVNWSAYEDIAEFFTNDIKDDRRRQGLRPHGLRQEGPRRSAGASPMPGSPWPATATRASRTACPSTNGASAWKAADPVGSSIDRGGDTNGPAAVYSITKYLEWLKKYAPPQAQGMTFSESGPVPAQGNIAQQMFWYTAFTADMVKPGLPVMNADGTPKWRMAPSPHGSYWKDGMKLGYQDAGSWTLLKSTPGRPPQGGLALCCSSSTSKTVSLKKSHVGLTFIRESDIWDKSFTERAPQARRPDRVLPLAGPRAVDADRQQRARIIRSWRSSGGRTSAMPPRAPRPRRQAMDALAAAQDDVLGAPRASRRAGRVRTEAQPEDLGRGLVQEGRGGRHDRAAAQAREREAEGRDDRLRHADQELAGDAAQAELSDQNDRGGRNALPE